MKRHKSTILPALLLLFLMGATAHAQAITQSPQDSRLAVEREAERGRILANTVRALEVAQERGGVRGGVGQPGDALNTYRAAVRWNTTQAAGAWWTNKALVERLGLTDDQKAKIERAFENHRQTIVSTTGLLEKEEAQLARLLEAETIDRNAVLTQTDRVIQARGEMERANAAMTLEMREHLTRAQWLQLPRTQATIRYFDVTGNRTGGPGQRGPAPTPPPSPPAPGTGGRRGRGQ